VVNSALGTVSGTWLNSIKQKSLLALNTVLDKLEPSKVKFFKDLDRIIKFQGKSLTEAAPEVREEAKKGLLKLWSILEPWDLEILMKRSMSEKEYEQVYAFLSKDSSLGEKFLVTNSRSKINSSEVRKKVAPKSIVDGSWGASPLWK